MTKEIHHYDGHILCEMNVECLRKGRLEEGFSEDPYLSGIMGIAAVRGLQGNQTDPGSNALPHKPKRKKLTNFMAVSYLLLLY